MRTRRSPSTRARTRPAMQLTERDLAILETIYAYDGILSLKQIDRLFFSGQGRTQPRARMRLLFDNHLVNMPSLVEQHRVPYAETIYWLTRTGAEYVAARQGVTVAELAYTKRPRWSQVSHDLAVNDVRITISQSLAHEPSLMLEQWVPESVFLATPDTIHYSVSFTRSAKRQVRPDGFFTVSQALPSAPLKHYAFLLEVDLATHSTRRFAREKVKAGVAYLKSSTFAERFGLKFGRWLVVTTSEQRLAHLKHQAEQAGGGKLFLFTTFKQLFASPSFGTPIWLPAGEMQDRSLIDHAR